jgi:hypothetical protein
MKFTLNEHVYIYMQERNNENVSEKRPKVKFDKENNDEITELLLAWIIEDKREFSVVENSKFKLLLESLYATCETNCCK